MYVNRSQQIHITVQRAAGGTNSPSQPEVQLRPVLASNKTSTLKKKHTNQEINLIALMFSSQNLQVSESLAENLTACQTT